MVGGLVSYRNVHLQVSFGRRYAGEVRSKEPHDSVTNPKTPQGVPVEGTSTEKA